MFYPVSLSHVNVILRPVRRTWSVEENFFFPSLTFCLRYFPSWLHGNTPSQTTKHSASLSSCQWGHSPLQSSSTEWELWNGESLFIVVLVQSFSSVWLFVTPWTATHQASLSITNSWSLLKLMSLDLVMPSNHLILCRLLLLPSIFPSIRVFSNESGLCIRWPKYWSFSFSISPSNEYSGLISLRIDWFDLLAVQGTLKRLLQHHSSKASVLQCSAFFMVQLPVHTKWV